MEIVEEMEEGIYASPEILSKDSTADRDLGLTLLPGSQIPKGIEARLKPNPEFKFLEGQSKENGGQGQNSQIFPRQIDESWGSNPSLPSESKPRRSNRYAEPNYKNQGSISKSPAERPRTLYSREKLEARLNPKPLIKGPHHCKPGLRPKSPDSSRNRMNEGNEDVSSDDTGDERDIRDLSQPRKRRKVERSNLNSNNLANGSRTRAGLNEICVKHSSGYTHVGNTSLALNDVADDSPHHSVTMATKLPRPSHRRNKTRHISSSEGSSTDGEDEDNFMEASTTHASFKNSISGLNLGMSQNFNRGTNKQHVRKMGSKHRWSKHRSFVRHQTPKRPELAKDLNNEGSSISHFLPNIGLASSSLESKATYSESDKRRSLFLTLPTSLLPKANYSELGKRKSLHTTSPTPPSSPSVPTSHHFLQHREAENKRSTFAPKTPLHTSKNSPSLHSISRPQTFGIFTPQTCERAKSEFAGTLATPSIKSPSNHSHRKRSTSLPNLRTVTFRKIMGSCNSSFPLNAFTPESLPASTNPASIVRQNNQGQVAVTEDISPPVYLQHHYNSSIADVLSYTSPFPRVTREYINFFTLNNAHKSALLELLCIQPVLGKAQRLLFNLLWDYQRMEASYNGERKTNNELRLVLQSKSQELLEEKGKRGAQVSALYLQAKDIYSKAKTWQGDAKSWETEANIWKTKAQEYEARIVQLQALIQRGVPDLASAEKIVEQITGVSPETQINAVSVPEQVTGVSPETQIDAANVPIASFETPIDLTGEGNNEVAPKPLGNEPLSQGQPKELIVERGNRSKRARYAWMGDQNPLRTLKRPCLDGVGGISDSHDNPPAFGTIVTFTASKSGTPSSGSEGKAGDNAKKSKAARTKPGPKRGNTKGKNKSSKQTEEVLREEAQKQAEQEAQKAQQAELEKQEAEKAQQAELEKQKLEAQKALLPAKQSRSEYLADLAVKQQQCRDARRRAQEADEREKAEREARWAKERKEADERKMGLSRPVEGGGQEEVPQEQISDELDQDLFGGDVTSDELDRDLWGNDDDNDQPLSPTGAPTAFSSFEQSVPAHHQPAVALITEDEQARKDAEQKAADEALFSQFPTTSESPYVVEESLGYDDASSADPFTACLESEFARREEWKLEEVRMQERSRE